MPDLRPSPAFGAPPPRVSGRLPSRERHGVRTRGPPTRESLRRRGPRPSPALASLPASNQACISGWGTPPRASWVRRPGLPSLSRRSSLNRRRRQGAEGSWTSAGSGRKFQERRLKVGLERRAEDPGRTSRGDAGHGDEAGFIRCTRGRGRTRRGTAGRTSRLGQRRSEEGKGEIEETAEKR